MYCITGTVAGHYATDVRVRAHQAGTGGLAGETLLKEGAYRINVAGGDDCYVILLPDIGGAWQTGRLHYLGDLVYPTDYPAVPYYFKCTGAGVVGQYEPVFGPEPLKTIIDGECRWERVERIPFPLVHYPVTPVLV